MYSAGLWALLTPHVDEKGRESNMKTISINVMNLCVPCENRCRYCLLSYSGKTTGVDFDRSAEYAKGFYDWIKRNRPELSFLFGFGRGIRIEKYRILLYFYRRVSLSKPAGGRAGCTDRPSVPC